LIPIKAADEPNFSHTICPISAGDDFPQEMAKIKRLEMEKANKAAAIAGMNLYKKAASSPGKPLGES